MSNLHGDMVWLHFVQIGGKDLEWGFDAKELPAIPAVGDLVWLKVGFPDKPFEEAFSGKIVDREWILTENHIEVCFGVEFAIPIPTEYEADSPTWPLEEFSKRKADTERLLTRANT